MWVGTHRRDTRRLLMLQLMAGFAAACGGRTDLDWPSAVESGGSAGRAPVGSTGGLSGGSGGAESAGGASGRVGTGAAGGNVGAGGAMSSGAGGSAGASAGGVGAAGVGAGGVSTAGTAGGLAGNASGGRGGFGAGTGGLAGAAGSDAAGQGGSDVVVSTPPRCEPAFSPVLDGHLPSDPGVAPVMGLTADFDGDGRLDVALSGGYSEVAVLLGRGDGSLTAGVVYPTGSSFVSGTGDAVSEFLLASDVNDDGRLDLVSASKLTRELSVLFGEAGGVFAAGNTCPLGGTPQGLAAGDFDGDGSDEIAVSYRTNGASGVNLLRGDGSCTSLGEAPEGTEGGPLAAGDLDGDGKLDLVVGNVGWDVLFGDGMGAFVPGEHFESSGSPTALVLEDFNRDGTLDVALSHVCSPWTDAYVTVHLGAGGGSFSTEQTYEPGTCGAPILVEDLNRDGALDLVPGETLLGNGDGTFRPAATGSQALRGSLAGIGDFDGDGVPDAAVATPDGVVVRQGTGDGTFRFVPHFATAPRAASLLLADMNDDGKLDVVTGNGDPVELGSASVSLLLGAGDGSFGAHADSAVEWVPSRLTAADMNGDGRLDLVALNQAPQASFSYLLQTSEGSFVASVELTPAAPLQAISVGDVNGDGKPDVVAVSGPPGTLGVSLGQEDGFLLLMPDVRLDEQPSAIALLDADGDGKLDLAIGDAESNSLRIHVGHADGTFTPAGDFYSDAPQAIAVGDLNLDGHADLVTSGRAGSTVLLGTGDGRFDAITDYPIGGDYVTLSDLDGDGHDDVLLSGPGLSVYRGAGDGTLTCFQTYAIGIGTTQSGAGDLNADGRVDVVALSSAVDVFLNAPP